MSSPALWSRRTGSVASDRIILFFPVTLIFVWICFNIEDFSSNRLLGRSLLVLYILIVPKYKTEEMVLHFYEALFRIGRRRLSGSGAISIVKSEDHLCTSYWQRLSMCAFFMLLFKYEINIPHLLCTVSTGDGLDVSSAIDVNHRCDGVLIHKQLLANTKLWLEDSFGSLFSVNLTLLSNIATPRTCN